ncbi:MAG: hypothetical protein M3P41_04465 [Actinomycetota bacterium]|nr:hypothetical protein [Actinomycetota bacterium]
MLAYSPDTWTQIIVAFSIFGPVAATAVIAWKVLRSARNDPDEQRWARLAEQRRGGDPDT